MPELPEVESVRRQLDVRLRGRLVRAVTVDPQARFGAVEKVTGHRIQGVGRRGKYLLAPLDGGLELVMHLGMTGSFRFRDADRWHPDAYVRATFELDDSVMDFRDVRRFGRLTVVTAGDYSGIATLDRLGPEPLSHDFDPAAFHRDLARSRMAVKPALLTQRLVAGVGNIYADEALWRARINPRARRLSRVRTDRLWQAIREVLAEAIEREGTTFRDYRMVNGQPGRNGDFLIAYGQAGRPCPRDGTPLRRIVLGGRGTTYCPRCQR
ncbi:MAG: bifunctional DNA-formamidopyrimidine glycosylase/DNA-(apurinic or apyrimidinic site) lyase [Nitriliruptorales bacterium]|nr:bifunctional DNA-formamidopyrimidine glycosylase/DNA-(apurinic or apyrimidinic site) lyase [Nitriliruptorales bacterium]